MQGGNAQLSLRLSKEAQDLQKNYADTLNLQIVDEVKRIWHINFVGPEKSVYAGEPYTLQFKFGSSYPFESPEV